MCAAYIATVCLAVSVYSAGIGEACLVLSSSCILFNNGKAASCLVSRAVFHLIVIAVACIVLYPFQWVQQHKYRTHSCLIKLTTGRDERAGAMDRLPRKIWIHMFHFATSHIAEWRTALSVRLLHICYVSVHETDYCECEVRVCVCGENPRTRLGARYRPGWGPWVKRALCILSTTHFFIHLHFRCWKSDGRNIWRTLH